MRSKINLLKSSTFESRYPRLVMVQSSSMMLVEMIDGKNEAQTHVNPVDFANSIEPSSFEYGPNWHDLIQVHVQFASKTLPDHESINRNGFCVKNLEIFLREKFG